MQRLIRTLGVWSLQLWGTSACHRYELRPVVCEPEPPGLLASSVSWEQVRPSTRFLRVQVRPITGDGPIASSAQVRLDSQAWRAVDADGATRFDPLSVGSHELAVRAIGYRAARVNVHVAPDAGVQAVAVMAVDPIRLDGGCGMMYQARKPWWKIG